MIFEQALASISFFSGLDPWDLDQIARLARPLQVEKDDVLFREGEVANDFFWIERGRVEISRQHLHFGKQTYAVLRAPAHFGALSLFYEEPHFATARALDPCRLVVVKHEEMMKLLATNHGLARGITQGMAASLRARNEEIRRLTSRLNRSLKPLSKLPQLKSRDAVSGIATG